MTTAPRSNYNKTYSKSFLTLVLGSKFVGQLLPNSTNVWSIATVEELMRSPWGFEAMTPVVENLGIKVQLTRGEAVARLEDIPQFSIVTKVTQSHYESKVTQYAKVEIPEEGHHLIRELQHPGVRSLLAVQKAVMLERFLAAERGELILDRAKLVQDIEKYLLFKPAGAPDNSEDGIRVTLGLTSGSITGMFPNGLKILKFKTNELEFYKHTPRSLKGVLVINDASTGFCLRHSDSDIDLADFLHHPDVVTKSLIEVLTPMFSKWGMAINIDLGRELCFESTAPAFFSKYGL